MIVKMLLLDLCRFTQALGQRRSGSGSHDHWKSISLHEKVGGDTQTTRCRRKGRMAGLALCYNYDVK
jgi:hypothetical protein